MSKFQIAIIAFLILAAFVAVLIFAGVLPGFNQKGGRGNAVSVSVWGPFSDKEIGPLISKFNESNTDFFSISYTEKDPANYKNNLLNAMAAGNSPDVWFVSQDMVLAHKDKIQVIPFASFSERNFKDMFIDSGDVFLNKKEENVVAFPYVIDPLVLYWNRDLFSSASIAQPPKYWDEFLANSGALTKINDSGNIIQSGAALGEFRNIRNAKEILSLMILQTGNKIINPVDLSVVWNNKNDSVLAPAENSLRFFGEFSNPKKTSYSWNRSLNNSLSMFAGGKLAMYFGYASEFNKIKGMNPHLNFDVAAAPQIKGGPINATFSKIYSLAISKTSPKSQAAVSLIYALLEKSFNNQFAESLFLAPARRDALSEGNKNQILSVFYKSAVMARTWLEPDSEAVSVIFQNMIESSVTGKQRISEAVSEATAQLENLLK
ncbi:MAG: extracellular solute-binding protein [Candidatus Paceibacterota bacterium]